MDYEVTHTEDVPLTDLSTVEDVPVDLDVRNVDEALGTDEVAVNLWYFEEGDEIGFHAHAEQEELFYVLEGRFSVKIGRPDDAEIVEVEAGGFWRAAPMVGRSHRCISEGGGVVLALGAPNVEDPGFDPHDVDDDSDGPVGEPDRA